MSSALKPVLTSSGAQNPPVASQLNKPMHPQNAPTAYGQPITHIPQNLVNISHNAPSSTNTHNPAHSNTHAVPHHINTNTHGTNHYSLNVPNASQHFSVGGSTPVSSHSAPVSSHPVSNVSQSAATYTNPAKNVTYNPNYQANLGHTYKTSSTVPSVPNISNVQPPPPQAVAATSDEPQVEKPQSNGTPEVKTSKPENPQNHVSTSPGIKDKPLPPSSSPDKAKVVPEKSVVTNLTPTVEQKQNTDANKPSEIINTSAATDKTPTSTGNINLTNTTSSSLVSLITSTSTSTTANSAPGYAPATAVTITAVSSVQTPQEVSSNSATVQETQESVPVSITPNNKPRDQSNQKSTLKLATTPRNTIRKAKIPKPEISDSPKTPKSEAKSSNQKSPGSGGKSKRTRTKTQPYQSPLPEVEMISKISATTPRNRNNEDKLIIFYKNEFLAVRNSEGGFYICQAVQNIYKSSPRIKIRWLSQDKADKEIYTPDFYDYTDFDCILTNLNLGRVGKGKYKLPGSERIRTDSILRRALAVEKGDVTPPPLTEEHPDGLDLSLYKEESQLKKRKAVKRKASASLKTSIKASSFKKSPDQPKVRKVVSKPKPPPPKKATVIKKALSIKKPVMKQTEKVTAKRRNQETSKSSAKTSSIIDQKKAKVLAKVARKTVTSKQLPMKQNVKAIKSVVVAKKSAAKKIIAAVAAATTTLSSVPATRKSKRGKK